uniref:Glycoside hydrolase family 28 n=1 Tax=Ramulus artemis TaxID=1390046 RepID=A0A191XT33_9NEOP|nr:glycoside hydrolase family 28 [Ramulus artemis]
MLLTRFVTNIRPHKFVVTVVVFAFISCGAARDLRNVTEPKNPETCTILKATGGDDTKLIQEALDSCAKGKAVALSSETFYSGPLTIPSGVSLLVDQGVTLKAIPDPLLYDLGAKTCGTLDDFGVGCKAFITINGAKSSGIYGKGTIDGQANVTMTGKNKTWWELSNEAVTAHNYQNNPMLVQINDSVDITVYQVSLINSPFYTLTAYGTNGWTVWGITILAPPTARNTDGIDPIGCQNVTIAHCYVSMGDDNVAIKALTGPSRHISVLNNHFDEGRGVSIGSEVNHGISDVYVANVTLNGSVNGIHIKSNTYRGGHIRDITYDNLCVYRAQHPIYLEMDYVHLHGNRTPEFRRISINNMKALKKGEYIIYGLSASNPVEVTLNNVHVVKGSVFLERFANITGKFEVEDSTGNKCGYAGID